MDYFRRNKRNLGNINNIALVAVVWVVAVLFFVETAKGEEKSNDNTVRRVILHPYRATLWKNGIAQSLTDEKKDAKAFSVFVSGEDVYVAGYKRNTQEKRVATLWKNGIAQSLTDGKRDTEALCVFVLGEDVYVAGYEEDPK